MTTDSDYAVAFAAENCIPEVPDLQDEVDKAVATAKGKVAELTFRPVDFGMEEYIQKFLSFDLITKILGKPRGLGYDLGKVTCDGEPPDAVFPEATFPNGAEEWVNSINSQIDAINGEIENIEIPPGVYSLDSAISILYDQIDSVSDVVDSAGI